MRFFSNHDERKFLLRRSIPMNFTSSTVKGSTIRLQEAKTSAAKKIRILLN
jgi:hypothetical protein